MVGLPQQAPSPHQAESRRTALQDTHTAHKHNGLSAAQNQLYNPTTILSLISAFQPSESVTCGFSGMWRCDESCKPQWRNDWILMWVVRIAHVNQIHLRQGIPPAALSCSRSTIRPSFKVESMHYKRRTWLLKGHCPLLDKSCSSGIILFISSLLESA